MSTTPFNRDAFNTAPIRKTANGVMAVITALQDEPKETQIAAIGCAFVLLAQHTNAHTGDLIGSCLRMLKSGEEHRPEFAAVRMFLENELDQHRKFF